MAVDEPKVVYFIGLDSTTGEVVLTISDHLDWKDSQRHRVLLQEKLNTYLTFVESKEIVDRYADARGRAVAIKIVFKFRPDEEGILFLARAKEAIQLAGFRFSFEVFADTITEV